MQRSGQFILGFTFVLLIFLTIVPVSAEISGMANTITPSGYYSFNEISGDNIFDSSGDGHFGLGHNISRIANSNCGNAIVLTGNDSYIILPGTTDNHPKNRVSVETRFLINTYTDAPMISTLNNGGYRLGFGDGNDLWWTVNVNGEDISVPLRHEEISLNTWHFVVGTYDGQQLKIFLDGKMLASKKAPGAIQYTYNNPVVIGAEAGTDIPDTPAPGTLFFAGAIDEFRIYPFGLTNGMVLDDMLNTCTPTGEPVNLNLTKSGSATTGQNIVPASLKLNEGEVQNVSLRLDSISSIGIWNVTVPSGTLLSISLAEIPATYPDAWEIAIVSNGSAMGENTVTAGGSSASAVIPNGNAQVTLGYITGEGRFPTHLKVQFASLPAPPATPTQTPSGPTWDMGLITWALAGIGIIAVIIAALWSLMRRREEKLRIYRR